MNDLPFKQGSSDGGPAFEFNRHGSGVLDKFGRDPVGLHAKEYPALLPCNRGLIGVAKPGTRVWSTACRSKVERLMTLSTSAVAVCRCSESRSSLRRRVFSMAMTAWLAKLLISSICLSEND